MRRSKTVNELRDELKGGMKKADRTKCFACGREIKEDPIYCVVSDFEPLCAECHGKKMFHVCASPSPCVDKKVKKLALRYDDERDILRVEGVKYAGAIFRELGGMLPEGELFRIERRENGVLMLRHERLLDERIKAIDKLKLEE